MRRLTALLFILPVLIIGSASFSPHKVFAAHALKTSNVVPVQIYRDAGPADGGAPGASEFFPICLTDPTTPHIQAVYAYDASTGVVPQEIDDIRTMMEESDRLVFLSADKQGGGRRLRLATEPTASGCQVSVIPIPIAHSYFTTGDETIIRQALNLAGFADPSSSDSAGVITAVFINHDISNNGSCGIGYNFIDDAIDGFNSKPSINFAEIWRGCWNAYVAIHEIIHTLGAVQRTAPHATPYGHCTDGIDIVCYDDNVIVRDQVFTCPSTPYRPGGLLDCNADDYFAVNPPPDSYLATHFNIANNSPYVMTVPYSGVPAPTIKIYVNPKASALPFVGVPFSAVITAPGGFLYAGGSQLSYGNRDCGVQILNPTHIIAGTSAPITISGIAYCKNSYSTIKNINNIVLTDQKPFTGSAISVVDSLGRDTAADINFKLIRSASRFPVKVTYNIKHSFDAAISNPFTVTLDIKGRLPGSKLFDTPLVGLDYIGLDQTTMKGIVLPGPIGGFVTTNASRSITVSLPRTLAGHLIDLELDQPGSQINWQVPITQFRLPKNRQ